MKKILAFLLTTLIIFSSFNTVVFAQTSAFTIAYSDGTSTTVDTLADAVAAANTKTDGSLVTITMNTDISNTTNNLIFNEGTNVVFDLGGNTLTSDRQIGFKGTAEVKNGTIIPNYTGRYALFVYGEVTSKAASLTISNLKINGKGNGIGTSTSTYPSDAKGATINVADNVEITVAGTALYTMRTQITYNIYGGLITCSDSSGKIFQFQSGTINIYGGTFKNTLVTNPADFYVIGNSKQNAATTIYGGTFPVDVSEHCADGYYSNKVGANEFVVEQAAVAKTVGTISDRYGNKATTYKTHDTTYKTLQYALDDTTVDTDVAEDYTAPANPPIVLLANNGEGAVANRVVTITKNGFTANVTAGEGYTLEETDEAYVITSTSSEPDPLPDGIVGLEDFEDSPKYSGSADSSQIIGVGGQASVKGSKGLIQFDNAHSGSYVAGVVKKQPYMSGTTYKIATSYRLKFYNLFGLKNFTPLNGDSITWNRGWEMFTEEDIGREFEISLWVYADSADGAYPSSGTGATEAAYKKITDVDVTNEATKPYMTVGLYGPSNDSDSDSSGTRDNDTVAYTYAGTPYDMCSKKVEWDTWTEFKINYTVTADTIYGSDGKTLVNAIGVNHQDPATDYYPSTFYVDDITVKELNMRPNILLVSENEIMADIKIPSSLIDDTKDQIVIASVYDKNTDNMIDAVSLGAPSASILTCNLDVNFNTDMTMKLFMWDGVNFTPIMENVDMDIPTLDTLKENVKFDRIAQSFYGDVYTQKSFNWYTSGLFASGIAYVEKTGDTPDWSKASYQKADAQYARYDEEILEFSGARQKTVLKGLKPNTKYFYKLGNKEFDVWSDDFTFQTADNTTNDAFFYLIGDPQSSSYSVAKPKGKMMDYIYENHPNGEFILSSGDLVIERNLEQEWVDVFNAESFANPNITFTGSPGDHDTNYAMVAESPNHYVEQAWSKHFNMPREEGSSVGKVYYSFDYKDMHIAIIDTTMLAPDASDDDEQIKWLKEDMQNTDKKWKIAITHESPQAPHNKALATSTTTTAYKLRKTIMTVATECGIDLFISGDRHLYSRTYPIYGLGGVLNETTGAVEPFETETALGNPDATVVKTEEINGKTTKFYDASEGVTYITVGSVATNAGGYTADALDSTKVLIPSYDVLHLELENFNSDDLANYSTYQTVTVQGDDLIISVYHYDLSNHEAGGTLYDQFALTKK